MHEPTSVGAKNSTSTAECLTTPIALRFVDPDLAATPVSAELRYRSTDPYAVTIAFRSGGQSVTWTFARELLATGIYEPTGLADVQVWPSLDSDGAAAVAVQLCSPDGGVLLEAPSRTITRFVERTLEMVPAGSESELVDGDRALAELLV
jgi:hypothetical protein